MADGEDRPIVVSGGAQMITVALPPSTKTDGRSHTVNAIQENGPFKTIVFRNAGTVEFSTPATADWAITIE